MTSISRVAEMTFEKFKSISIKKNNMNNEIGTVMTQNKMCLDDFNLKETLGTGTYGRVRLGSFKDGSFYAIKILKKAHVLEKNENKRNLYLVLDFVQGGELYSQLRRRGSLSDRHARFYTMEIICVFEYLHRMEIIYRDLKPENILLTESGNVKVADFGFAKEILNGHTSTLCGTPEYLAPELLRGDTYGKSTDWWTLGILVFEMLAGYPPFYDKNQYVLFQVLNGRIHYPESIEPNAKQFIKNMLTNTLAKRMSFIRNNGEDIKKYLWFSDCSWEAALAREVEVPFKPKVKDVSDSSYFPYYSDSDEEEKKKSLSKDEIRKFKAFENL